MKASAFGPSLSRGVTGRTRLPMGGVSGAEQRIPRISAANTLRKGRAISGTGCTLDT